MSFTRLTFSYPLLFMYFARREDKGVPRDPFKQECKISFRLSLKFRVLTDQTDTFHVIPHSHENAQVGVSCSP